MALFGSGSFGSWNAAVSAFISSGDGRFAAHPDRTATTAANSTAPSLVFFMILPFVFLKNPAAHLEKPSQLTPKRQALQGRRAGSARSPVPVRGSRCTDALRETRGRSS